MEKRKYYRCEPNDTGSFNVRELMLYGAGKNCFLTKEEAVKHFENAERVALDKYEKLMIGISKLKKEIGDFNFGCEIEVLDDSGLETTMYVEFLIDGYEFRYNQN